MPTLNECYVAAVIIKPHGIKGEVKVRFDVDDISDYKKQASFYLSKRGEMTLFHVSGLRILDSEFAIVSFKEITDRNAAELLRGAELLLELSNLPERSGDQFYYHDLVGLTVEDKHLGTLGTVKGIMELPAQDILEMEYQGKEVLLPVTEEFILNANFEKNILYTNLPEGILEIYLEDPKDKKD